MLYYKQYSNIKLFKNSIIFFLFIKKTVIFLKCTYKICLFKVFILNFYFYIYIDLLTNYRPIHHLPIISKIMERIVSRQLIIDLRPSRVLKESHILLKLLSTILLIRCLNLLILLIVHNYCYSISRDIRYTESQ